jgi:transposase InsO family protein
LAPISRGRQNDDRDGGDRGRTQGELRDGGARTGDAFKTELPDGRRLPSFEHAEHATLAWIGFYNDDRLHENLGDIPPAEYGDDYYRLNYKEDNSKTLRT